MITDPPLYTGKFEIKISSLKNTKILSGSGVRAHSIRRRKITPPIRQRTLPEPESPNRRPPMVRQRSLSPTRVGQMGMSSSSPRIAKPRHCQSYTNIVTTNRYFDEQINTEFVLVVLSRFPYKETCVGFGSVYLHRSSILSGAHQQICS